jgi:hypothetical protein
MKKNKKKPSNQKIEKEGTSTKKPLTNHNESEEGWPEATKKRKKKERI